MSMPLRRKAAPVVVEQRDVRLSGTEISYTLKRKGYRRSISLRVDDRGLTVSAPLRASEKWVHEVLQEKADWVLRQLDDWMSKKAPPIFWAEGARIPFRGENFLLTLTPGANGAKPALHGEVLHVPAGLEADAEQIRKVVEQWYRDEALRVFEECVEYFAPLLQVAPSRIRLSTARTQWGSCTARGIVSLNWQLVKMPLHLIDYVVVHELAHLKEMNHSSAFWQVVESVCPDYKRCRAELHGYGVAE
jgi:hypothetical protein